MNSFEEYLLNELSQGKIDFSLRAHVEEDGHPVFYIHPTGRDGTTLDFVAIGGCLIARQSFPPYTAVV
jgi:hypothetical protein